MTESVWAVISGSYDNHYVFALFEREEDAKLIADRLQNAPGRSWGAISVEQHDFYRAGDTSLGYTNHYVHMMDVKYPDWTLQDIGGYVTSVINEKEYPPLGEVCVINGAYRVVAVGPSEDLAREAAILRATEVAATVTERGIDVMNAWIEQKKEWP